MVALDFVSEKQGDIVLSFAAEVLVVGKQLVRVQCRISAGILGSASVHGGGIAADRGEEVVRLGVEDIVGDIDRKLQSVKDIDVHITAG